MEVENLEKVISDYKIKFTEMDKAIAARDNLIDSHRQKTEHFRRKYEESRNTYYKVQDEADEANHNFDILNDKFKKLMCEHQNLQSKYDDLRQVNTDDRNDFDQFVEKYENDISEKDNNICTLNKKLLIAKNAINELKEEIENKNIIILNMQSSNNYLHKFTTETQTSLKDEIESTAIAGKIADKKKQWLSKFEEVHEKINLQIVNLVSTVGQLKLRNQESRCKYGWNCKRKFCKFSHEYLYCYSKVRCAKRDKDSAAERNLESHVENIHAGNANPTNLQPEVEQNETEVILKKQIKNMDDEINIVKATHENVNAQVDDVKKVTTEINFETVNRLEESESGGNMSITSSSSSSLPSNSSQSSSEEEYLSDSQFGLLPHN